MKTLPCSCGKLILVDDEAYNLLSRHSWCCISRDSVYTKIEGKSTALPRLIMAVPPGFIVDHINRDGHDNQIHNLRLATQQQNMYNSGPKSNSQTGIKGVHLDERRNKWYASIRINGKKKNLGRYEKIEDAIAAYNEAAKKHHGQFAYVSPLKQPTQAKQ